MTEKEISLLASKNGIQFVEHPQEGVMKDLLVELLKKQRELGRGDSLEHRQLEDQIEKVQYAISMLPLNIFIPK